MTLEAVKRITFYPDSEIFSTTEFDFSVLKKRLQEIAFLNPVAKIILSEEKTGKKEEKPKVIKEVRIHDLPEAPRRIP